MTWTEVPTYTVRLYVAGDIESAKRLLRREFYSRGGCVTVERTDFLYTGGEEAGMVIGFVNYPRFPKEPADIWQRAAKIAEALLPELNQKTALLVAPDRTAWLSWTPPGARE